MRRRLAIVAAVALLGSCGGDDGGGGDAAPASTAAPTTTATSSSTTTAPEPPDPFTVPEDPVDIDEAYVEAVINEHNRVIGDALRIQLEGGDVQEIIDRYNAIYVPEVADLQLNALFAQTDEEIAQYRRPPGNGVSTVLRLVEVAPTCIVVEVRQSAEQLVDDPPEAFVASITLRRTTSPPSRLNRTSWISEGLTDVVDEEGPHCTDT